MWNTPTQEELLKLPPLYATEHTPMKDKMIRMHFFIGGCDWYVAEFDGDDLLFGFVVLNEDYRNAEWGYSSLSELKSINVHGFEIDRNLCWQPKRAVEIDKICRASGWEKEQTTNQAEVIILRRTYERQESTEEDNRLQDRVGIN